MKRYYYIYALLLSLLSACTNNGEKEAEMHLQRAESAFNSRNYNEAKLQIDTIRTLYPKAFDARKAAIKLMQQVDLKEQERSIVYLDSMMLIKQAQFDSIKGSFILEKDKEYQEVGNYLYPTQTIEKNGGRSFLRGQVSELGEMSITSIYCAGGAIHHSSVKVINGDLYAQTPNTKDSYETTIGGRHIEKADYKLGDDGGVIAFIVTNKANNLKLQFIGDKTYTTSMTNSDREAIYKLSELAKTLSSIEQIKKDKDEANLKIRFVKRKMEEQSSQK
ncbi:hypothetical protein [Phocaeicola paurosaccharolyticus]|uniref:hypothetical protein n=1 Tax=Phocaeicola paurosaccharolyticus TaxID=732242 RepID=UPI00046A011A|nr:hypothetical protein [Phocaeicola paurosaccharolyticus]